MRKNSVVKNFRLSKLQTIIITLFLCGNKIFMCLIFVVHGVRRKFFHAEFFPDYGNYQQVKKRISVLLYSLYNHLIVFLLC